MPANKKKGTKNTAKFFVLVLLLSGVVMLGSPNKCHAFWGPDFAAMLFKQMLEEARKLADAVLLTGTKQAEIKKTINSVRGLVAGTAGQTRVVSDYQDFIFNSTQKEADNSVTNFFSARQTGGVSPETRSELRTAEVAVRNELAPPAPGNFLDHTVNSATPRKDIFDQTKGGGQKAYLGMQMSNEDHPADIFLGARDAVNIEIEQSTKSKETNVLAGSGFPTYTNDSSVVPGSVVQGIVKESETMPIQMINNATNWQEVVTATTLSPFIEKGINLVSRPINAQIRVLNRSDSGGVDGVLEQVYDGVRVVN